MAKTATIRSPSHFSAESGSVQSHQAFKSAQTRAKLIEATIRCLVKYGFANTTTPKVAAEAKMSRGAMLHHFKNSAELIRATIVELHEKRLRALRRYAKLDHTDVRTLVRAYWGQLSTSSSFIAFHELAIAARTDKKFAQVLAPLEHEYRERWYAEVVSLFPEWQINRSRFDLALMMSRTMLEGLALAKHTSGVDEYMLNNLLDLVEDQVRSMRPTRKIAMQPK